MINNAQQIKQLLDFTIDGTFYMVQIMRRRKDQLKNDSQKGDNITIKNYFIDSYDNFDKKIPEIIDMCECFNARAYIRLNRCFYDKVALETLAITAEYIKNGNNRNVKSVYATACGRRCYDSDKKWIIDIDEKQINHEIIKCIKNACSKFDENIIAILETVNGYHIVTHPFDLRDFVREYPFIDIHKNNPTLLYY